MAIARSSAGSLAKALLMTTGCAAPGAGKAFDDDAPGLFDQNEACKLLPSYLRQLVLAAPWYVILILATLIYLARNRRVFTPTGNARGKIGALICASNLLIAGTATHACCAVAAAETARAGACAR